MEPKQISLAPELVPRLAAIDIGTNSIRLIIAEALRHGNYRILDDEKAATRLGRNLTATGRLDPAAVEESLGALRRMRQIAEGYQVSELRAIATCAVREAADGDEFCRRALDEVGLPVEVVSSKEEARLAFYGVARSFDLAGTDVAVADIGGGSTEIILASGNVIEETYATPLGAVRFTEVFGLDQAVGDESFERLIEGINDVLRKKTKKPLFIPHLLIGSGGTFTTLAAMVMAGKGQGGLPVQGYPVTHAEVRHLLDRLRKLNAKARRGFPGLSSDRADIIVAGLAVVDRVMRWFRVNRLQVHTGGVRDGLLLTMVDKSFGARGASAMDRDAGVERFAAGCGTDVVHCSHVARLAGLIYSQLAEPFELDPADRPLLETAAKLQDVGYLINYDQHHKHSFHLILNSRLAGFLSQDLELIANIARYHRGARPKPKHGNYRRLSPADRRRVLALAAILRLAGGLDRSHSQQIQGVELDCRKHEVLLTAVSAQIPEVDLYGARRRARFFEKVFDRKLSIEWRAAARDGQASAG